MLFVKRNDESYATSIIILLFWQEEGFGEMVLGEGAM